MSLKLFRPVLAAWFAVAFVLLLSLAPTARAESVAITEGTVNWGFKQSWRTYIGEAGITVSDGATRAADGTFNWPVAGGSYDTETRALELELAGTVKFYAHGGLLDATLSNGRLLINSGESEIRFDIRSKNMDGEPVEFTDAPLSSLDAASADPVVSDGTTTWEAIPNAITQEGMDSFTYGTGTMLDPLNISYKGPGGKPDFAETWTAPGSHRYDKVHLRNLLPEASWAAWIQDGFIDEEAGVVHAFGHPDGDPRNHLLAIDLATGQVIGQAGPLVGAKMAFDPENHTVFVAGQGKLNAYAWDVDEQEYTAEELHADAPGSGLAYDPVTETVAVLNGNGTLVLAKRDSDGEFTATKQEITGVSYAGGIVLDGHGSMLFATSLGATRVWEVDLDASPLVPEPVDGIGTIAYNGVALGADGEAWAYGSTASNPRMQRLVKGPDGYAVSGDPVTLPLAPQAMKPGPGGGTMYAISPYYSTIQVIEDGVYKGMIETMPTVNVSENKLIVEPRADGSLLVASPHPSLARPNDTAVSWPLDRYDLTAVSPGITTQPEEQTVKLGAGETSTETTFSAEAAGTPAPEVKWQSRAGTIGRFVDIPGETGDELTVNSSRAQNGSEYRAVFANDGGAIATEPAGLTVRFAPEVSQQPVSMTVAEGEDATFKVMPIGNPHPDVTWERRVSGFWVPVNADGIDIVTSGEGNGFLTIKGATVEQSGAVFRARVENEVGVVYSNRVTLTTESPITEAVTFGSGHLDWGFANRWRCYVTGTVARGGIELTGGVTRIPGTVATGGLCPGDGSGSEAMRFPVLGDSYDPATRRLEVRLGGQVRFWGHAHHTPGSDKPQLDTTFSNLRVVLEAGTGTLYADAVGSTMEHPDPIDYKDVALVSIDASTAGPAPTGNGLAWETAPTELTPAGAAVFGSYPQGEPFDPISMSLVYGTPQTDPDPDPVKPVTGKVKVVTGKGARMITAGRRARLATVICPSAKPCRVAAPKRVRVKIGGKRFNAKVLLQKRVAAGRRAPLSVKFTKRAVKRLKRTKLRRTAIRVKFSVVTDGKRSTHVVKAKVKARKATMKR